MDGWYYYGIDTLYLYLVVPAILLLLFSQMRVRAVFSKYSALRSDMTGAEAARAVLEKNGIYNVKIEQVTGKLTDHYDPRGNVIRLSEAVYGARSYSAVGVAAHEAGHAVQYARGYVPVQLRAVILPVCNLGSQLSVPLLIVGLLLNFYFLVKLGVILFGAALIFQLVTLPIELNASRRALSSLKSMGALNSESDEKAVRRVLSAAAMTYIAALLVSLTQLIRLVSLTKGRKK